MKFFKSRFFILLCIFTSLPIITTGDALDEWTIILSNLELRTAQINAELSNIQHAISELEASFIGPPRINYSETLAELEVKAYQNLQKLEEIKNELQNVYKNVNDHVVNAQIDLNTSTGLSKTYGGDEISLTLLSPPYIVDEQVLFSIRDIAYLFNIAEENISFTLKDDMVDQITILYDEIVYKFNIGNRVFYKDDEALSLNVAPVITYGYTYLPIEDIAILFDFLITVNNNIVSIIR
ncbi:stalk domain-containing protein [Candidatus Epulonipiscium viviparus]|uniref:stalk domain-containing protein n=1 Tax=Candidatus Epulonipiscium viviparus TaxID=420336 RepID=UPI002738167C|nr:stalk domain-containing protein [Candidatus Epulopiscium viviparus]